MSERWGTRRDSENASAEPSYTEGREAEENDKPHIRQLVGYGLRCGQDSLAFSNELFGGFLMHGKKLDVSRIMKFVMLMSGMVICFA